MQEGKNAENARQTLVFKRPTYRTIIYAVLDNLRAHQPADAGVCQPEISRSVWPGVSKLEVAAKQVEAISAFFHRRILSPVRTGGKSKTTSWARFVGGASQRLWKPFCSSRSN